MAGSRLDALAVPEWGERIGWDGAGLGVPDTPVVPFIAGDGTGPEIWQATRRVIDAAVERASGGRRRVAWVELEAGEKAFARRGTWLPD